MSVNLKVREVDGKQVVEFELDGAISADELKNIEAPEVDARKGVIISGRGPVWLHSYLAHEYHYTAWVAHYDPRIGAVVVQSHTQNVSIGDIIDIKL